jgi:RNA polymerase sigma-70 factor (ECF subfamily)
VTKKKWLSRTGGSCALPFVDPDEARLVERLRGGDGRALADVYALYHERIWSFLLRLSGRRHLAEDLFQETWLAVARGAARLRDDTDLRAWLFTVARNRHRSYRRWAVLDIARLLELGAAPAALALAPDQEAEARAEAARAEAAFARLSDAHREVLLLVVGEGLDATRAGAVLGLSPDALRQRLHRARAELAEAVEQGEALTTNRPRRRSAS